MNLEEQLREAFAPCEPGPAAEAAVMALVFGGAKRKPRGSSGRRILLGTMLSVAAAAAWLVLRPDAATPPPMVATQVMPVPAAVEKAVAELLPLPPAVAAPEPARKPSTSAPAVPVQSFTVRVTLEDRSTDAASKAAVAALHAAFLERLSVIPGLLLTGPDTETAPDAPVHYRIRVTGTGPQSGNKVGGNLQAEKLGPDGKTVRGNLMLGTSVDLVPVCIGPAAADLALLVADPGPCRDPASIAAIMVSLLRTKMFPADASLQRQLQAQLRDSKLDQKERLRALGDYMSVKQWSPAPQDSSGSDAPIDPLLVRGAIDLAATATDPAVRAQVWRTMREAHSPELRQPLIAAARSEPDGEARLEAVATLARDFANDPPGRAALEAVASEDSRPLIRAAARRGLAGDAAWREYVVSSLKDAGRSDEERVEALVHDMFERNLPNSVASYWIRTRELLDDEAIRSLAQLLPQLRPSMQLTSGMLGQLVTDVASIDHPAVTDMLLGGLAGNGSLIGAATAAHGLLDRGDDPRVRAALQGSKDPRVRAQLQLASVSDRDPRRREMAAEMLKAATAAATE